MKNLFVVRHAKSSWESAFVNDHDRPLNARGMSDAPEMAQRLANAGFTIGKICSSSARRAFTTAEFFAEALGFEKKDIQVIAELYHAPPSEFWKQARQLPATVSSAIFFSHNPGITLFANETGVLRIDNMPTCSVLGISFNAAEWKQISPENANLLHFDYPKKAD